MRRREAAGGGGGDADTELKTKTPHVNVGKYGATAMAAQSGELSVTASEMLKFIDL